MLLRSDPRFLPNIPRFLRSYKSRNIIYTSLNFKLFLATVWWRKDEQRKINRKQEIEITCTSESFNGALRIRVYKQNVFAVIQFYISRLLLRKGITCVK